MKTVIHSYCGLDCGECEFQINGVCNGCIVTEGNPFHGKCEVAECAKKKKVRFCGECPNLPCEIITKYSNDEEHGDNPKGARIEKCKELKLGLVAEARAGIETVGYCGHHCDYCWMGQWCGGCRSDYNCCSYATLKKDKVCPNVKCCKEINLTGCYECNKLSNCKKGYYSRKNEFVAKATALFIQKNGLECYKKSLSNAISNGIEYPKNFDESGSIENALALLEKYRR